MRAYVVRRRTEGAEPIAGNHAVFFGFDLTEQARDGCLGLASAPCGPHRPHLPLAVGVQDVQVPGADAGPDRGLIRPQDHPIQAMWWGDYTVKPGRQYRYTVGAALWHTRLN